MSGKRDLLLKIKALADRSEGGEKINAQRKLAEYMEKYGISEHELEDTDEGVRAFFYSGEREKRLLAQIMYKVTNEKDRVYTYSSAVSGRTIRTKLGCLCTKSQEIEIQMLFDFYKRLYKREEETLFSAFVQKHEIFGRLKEGESPDKVDMDELMRIMQISAGLHDETPLKQICGGDQE